MADITDKHLAELFNVPPFTNARQDFFICKRLDCIKSDGVGRCQVYLAAEMEFGECMDYKRDPLLCECGEELEPIFGSKRAWMRRAECVDTEACGKCAG